MRHLKIYELYNENSIDKDTNRLVKCNWCDWFGLESELTEDNCPNCQTEDYLMDIEFNDYFYEYVNNNDSKRNIDKKDYNNIEDYYKALYPEYFITNKYNL